MVSIDGEVKWPSDQNMAAAKGKAASVALARRREGQLGACDARHQSIQQFPARAGRA
jgi:hypothetical protein